MAVDEGPTLATRPFHLTLGVFVVLDISLAVMYSNTYITGAPRWTQ